MFFFFPLHPYTLTTSFSPLIGPAYTSSTLILPVLYSNTYYLLLTNTMPIFGEKPFTSITVKINQLCKPHRNDDLEDDSIEPYVTDLLDLIKLQSLGATEAARAIRKKIKYGNSVEEQLLALSLLELLVLNAGTKIGLVIASDEKLVELLRNIIGVNVRTGLGADYDKRVVHKVVNLAIGWKSEFADLDGYRGMANLWKAIPRKKGRNVRLASAARMEDDDFGADSAGRAHHTEFSDEERTENAERSYRSERGSESEKPSHKRTESGSHGGSKHAPPRPTAASPYLRLKTDEKKKKKKSRRGVRYADEQYKIPQINYKVEAPKIRTVIADCYTHTTALNNHLLGIPAGSDPLNDDKVAQEFEKCRRIRRLVLRYLQYVGAGDAAEKLADVVAMDEEFLGSLIVANEQLVTTFQALDRACGYTEENPAPTYSDEEEEESDESYYLSESDSDLVSQRLDDMTVESSSRLQDAVKVPPPRPKKSEKLRTRASELKPPLAETQSVVSVDSADPFGDSHEVETGELKYY